MKLLGLLLRPLVTLVAAITRTLNSHMNTQMGSRRIFHTPLLVGYSTQYFTQEKILLPSSYWRPLVFRFGCLANWEPAITDLN